LLLIRKEQMEILSRSGFRHQLRQWARELRAELPSQTRPYSDPDLQRLVDAGVTAAQKCGFTEDLHIREYLKVILRTGADLEGRPTNPAIRALVEDSASSPWKKMDRLALLLPDPNAADENRMALAEAGKGRTIPSATPSRVSEPERPIDPRFLKVDGREAVPEPDEPEY
jgi:hypothetical protein